MKLALRTRSQVLKYFALPKRGETGNEVIHFGLSLTTDLWFIECSYLVQSMKYHITILVQNHKSTILDVPYVPNLVRAGFGSIDENLTSPRQFGMIRNAIYYYIHVITRTISPPSTIVEQHVYSVSDWLYFALVVVSILPAADYSGRRLQALCEFINRSL